MRKIHLGILVLIVLALCLPSAQAIPGQATQRLIVHTTAPFEKGVFQHQGCTIVHELNDATAIECPAGVFVPNAEPDEILQILDTTSDAQIHADDVWASSITGEGVVVAVLDTGVDAHPALGAYNGTTSLPVDVNGGVGGGKSFVSYTTAFSDDNIQYSHGTHVSGIITADGGDAKGVAPDATVWMAKVCNYNGSCYTTDMAAAIEYVVNNKIAKVMSISIGGGGTPRSACDGDYLAQKINWAYDKGVVAAIAAGNGGTKIVESPACASKAIAVAAVDRYDVLAYFSSYGKALKDHGVAAPGVNINSTFHENAYACLSGTSMATPHVSALAALMLQKTPDLNPADIRSRIFQSADCLGDKYGACPNIYIGFGRVNASAAVNWVGSEPPSPPPSDCVKVPGKCNCDGDCQKQESKTTCQDCLT